MEGAASIVDFLQEEVSKMFLLRLTSTVIPSSYDADRIAIEPGTLADYQIVLGKPNTSPENSAHVHSSGSGCLHRLVPLYNQPFLDAMEPMKQQVPQLWLAERVQVPRH